MQSEKFLFINEMKCTNFDQYRKVEFKNLSNFLQSARWGVCQQSTMFTIFNV
jgi:hypothetical protein